MARETLASSGSFQTGSGAVRTIPPPPEDAWIDAYRKLAHRWPYLTPTRKSAIPIAISRVNQIDAARLDLEMSAMLKEQLVKVFSLMKPGMLFQYEPELDAFLEFLIWWFSIWVDKPTPGNALMNLRYRDERAFEMQGKASWVWLLIQRVEGIYKAASFSNLLLFLYTGRYKSLTERALRARLVYGSPNMNRVVSFEYMNHQLVWHELSEMLLLLLPLLNSSSIKKILCPFSKDKSSNSATDETLCPICQATPTLPFFAIPCQHRFCYYCLQTRCSAAPFRCTRCGELVAGMQRHGRGNAAAIQTV